MAVDVLNPKARPYVVYDSEFIDDDFVVCRYRIAIEAVCNLVALAEVAYLVANGSHELHWRSDMIVPDPFLNLLAMLVELNRLDDGCCTQLGGFRLPSEA